MRNPDSTDQGDTVAERGRAAAGATLPAGTLLHWYRIEGILGCGGFGVTYLAHDTNLGRDVAIKEFFPSGLARREPNGTVSVGTSEARAQFTWGLDRFISEGRTLARFDHPGVVGVIAVFEDNDTAYLVMRYEDGLPLSAVLKRDRTMSERRTRRLLANVCDGLKAVHDEGFIHRDIKPANLIVREDGTAVLIDFGSARIAVGQQTSNLTSLVSPGYAPFEQYYSDGARQGPWTDIYALGATAYRMLTGVAPPPAIDRSKAVLEGGRDPLVPLREISTLAVSSAFADAVDWALAFRAADRPSDLTAWCRAWVDTEPVDTARSAPRAMVDVAGSAPSAGADPETVRPETTRPLTGPHLADRPRAFDLGIAGDIGRRLFSATPWYRRHRHAAAFVLGVLVSLGGAAALVDPIGKRGDAETKSIDAAPRPPDEPGVVISETVETRDIVPVRPVTWPPAARPGDAEAPLETSPGTSRRSGGPVAPGSDEDVESEVGVSP